MNRFYHITAGLVLALTLAACCQEEAAPPPLEPTPATSGDTATDKAAQPEDPHAGHDHAPGQHEGDPQIDTSAKEPQTMEEGGLAPPPGEQAPGEASDGEPGEQELVDLENSRYEVEPHKLVQEMDTEMLKTALARSQEWKLHREPQELDGGQQVVVEGKEGALLEILFVEKEDQEASDAYMMELEKNPKVAMARSDNKFIVVTPVQKADGESAQLLLRQVVVPLKRIPKEEGDADPGVNEDGKPKDDPGME